MEVTLNNVLSIDSLHSIIADKYPGLKKNNNYLSLVYDGFLLDISHKEKCVYAIDRDVPILKCLLVGVAVIFGWVFLVIGCSSLISTLDISVSLPESVAKYVVIVIVSVPIAILRSLWKIFLEKGVPSVVALSHELTLLCNMDSSQKHLSDSASAVLEDIKTKAIKKRLKKLIISIIVSIVLIVISYITTDKTAGDMALSFGLVGCIYVIYCAINLLILKRKKAK